jgi:hypothetical protein
LENLMSVGIVVLRPKQKCSSLMEVEDVDPIDTLQGIREKAAAFFAGLAWSSDRFGLWSSSDGYWVEFNVAAGDNPMSLHLTLYIGSNWTPTVSDRFYESMQRLYRELGWQAFAVSNNSALFLENSGA